MRDAGRNETGNGGRHGAAAGVSLSRSLDDMNATITSNNVEVEPLVPPRCDNCTVQAAVVVVRITGTPVVREVCQPCLIDNDGRTGWPIYADISAAS